MTKLLYLTQCVLVTLALIELKAFISKTFAGSIYSRLVKFLIRGTDKQSNRQTDKQVDR